MANTKVTATVNLGPCRCELSRVCDEQTLLALASEGLESWAYRKLAGRAFAKVKDRKALSFNDAKAALEKALKTAKVPVTMTVTEKPKSAAEAQAEALAELAKLLGLGEDARADTVLATAKAALAAQPQPKGAK